MTFTLNLTLPLSNLTRVRLAIGDIRADAAMLSDEIINAHIATEGTWQAAAIACVRTLLAEMSATPDYKADWLEVDAATAAENLRALLASLQAQYGLGVKLDSASVQAVTWDDDPED
jgi:hypothetical protein